MNVLFLSSEFPTHVDPNRALFNRQMVRGLANRHRVNVVCPIAWTDAIRGWRRPPRAPVAETFSASYPWFFFPPRLALHRRGTWMWWSLRRALVRHVRCQRPHIVLSYWAHPDGEVALRLARRLGVPIALMVGGSDVLVLTQDSRRRARIEAVLRGVDAVMTVGQHLRSRVIALGVPASRVTAVMRPVDVPRSFEYDRAAVRRRLGLPSDHGVLLWVGRLVKVKGVDTLLRAAAILKEGDPHFVLCLAGDGPEARALRALAGQLGVDPVVRWLGAVPHDELPAWYRSADVTVLPSHSEGVPNVLLESIACGTPFVASRVGSIPDIADDACDRLVPPGQPEALAVAIAEVLSQRNTPVVRTRRVAADEPEYQAHLDGVLNGCVAGATLARPSDQRLRSAVLLEPNRWRQTVRTAMVRWIPRRWLMADCEPASLAVCLTFDDGPHETITPRVLDILKDLGVRATFFVRGDHAHKYPALLRRIASDGHLLGHHSWSHGPPGHTSTARLLTEVRRTRNLLRLQVGTDSRWFRPPHGKVTISKVLALWSAGMTVALWNVDPGDVFQKHAQGLLDWFRANPPRAGDVVLLHDTTAVTLEALPDLIMMIRSAGLELTTLDRCGG